MPINLFLDANILLSFYALSNADIEQLKQLKGVVASGDIRLFLNEQLMNEVERNREKKIVESVKALREDKFKCRAPSFVRQIKEFEQLQGLIKEANSKHSELIKIVSSLVESRDLEADKIIAELIETAGFEKTTDVQFALAHKRFLTGNPPGKKKATIGDELNWEFLLQSVPTGEDLHLVSVDGDYASPADETKANAFLLREWNEAKGAPLHYYRDLNEFFKLHVPKIKLANQEKINSLIAELSGSESFADTHQIIAKFPDDPELSDAQVVELFNIKENNSQVGWISGDPDVAAFYSPLTARYLELRKAIQNNEA